MKLVQYIGKPGPLRPGSEAEVWNGPEAVRRGVVFEDVVIDVTVLLRPPYHDIFVTQPTDFRAVYYLLEQFVDWCSLYKRLEGRGWESLRHWWNRLEDVRLVQPVDPPSFRDFYAFEQHVRSARRKRGLEMVPEWYEAPVFYFSNTASIVGPGAPVRKPPETRELDYELEVAVVIGKEGGDIPVEEADGYIAGFTILNDWSARDVQRREMKVGLGPAKGKDFATSIGPWLVTPDEFENRIVSRERGARYDLTMAATVNGREYSRGNLRDMNWTFAELIAEASRNTVLRPGDLIGSGTVGTGCITEFPEGTLPWLQPGDEVTLEVEGLGALTNTVVE